DNNGVQWIAFEYSRDRVKMEYTIRCDVENINIETLTQEFKTENCVYPRACCSKDQYRGNRLVAELNPCLRGKRGLIQRAVDSWRNSNQDPRLRSRRVRRMAKLNNRKAVSSAQHPGAAAAAAAAAAAHLAGPGTPVTANTSLAAPGALTLGGAQLHHHHAHPDGGPDDVSGNHDYTNGAHRPSTATTSFGTPTDMRPAHIFHGYPSYPSSNAATSGPSMAPPLRDTSLDHYPKGATGVASSLSSSSASASSNKFTGGGGSSSSISSVSHDHNPNEDHSPETSALFGDLPEGRRRKFILVEDPQRGCRVRVKVMLDQVDMKEIPDSYRKSNSVFPRTYFPVHGPFGPPGRGRRFADSNAEVEGDSSADGNGGDDEEGAATLGRTVVPVPMLDGDGSVAVPRIAKRKRDKEVLLNDLGYRMSWGQSRVFSGRTLFLQRALDAYRNKMRNSMLTAGQEPTSIASHFETRAGKRRWLDRSKRDDSHNKSRSPAAVETSSSARHADEVQP
ncbi:hypothetical protein LOZ32_006868, partial [Ophidiomyces ophidiicola]